MRKSKSMDLFTVQFTEGVEYSARDLECILKLVQTEADNRHWYIEEDCLIISEEVEGVDE